MSSSKKRQSNRKTETPDWADDVKPSEDVMAMFYAPTGQPKPGPLIALPQPNTTTTAVEPSDTSGEAKVNQPVSVDQQSDLEDKLVKASAPEQNVRTDVQSHGEADLRGGVSPGTTRQLGEQPQDAPVTRVGEEMLSRADFPQAQMSAMVEGESPEHAGTISSGLVIDNGISVERTAAKAEEFEEYFGQWTPFLTEGQRKILRALYEMTHALGRSECFTSTSRLAAAAGMSERQTSSIARDLEKLGFISRPETFNTRTKKGTIFKLFLSRQDSATTVKRHYYFED